MDGWNYTMKRGAFDSLPDKAERDFPGWTFISAFPITTGLWRDVWMRNGTTYERKHLYF